MINSGLLKFSEKNKYSIVEVPYIIQNYEYWNTAELNITYGEIGELLKNGHIVCFQVPADKNVWHKPLTFFVYHYAINESGELTEIAACMAGAWADIELSTWLEDYDVVNQDANVYLIGEA